MEVELGLQGEGLKEVVDDLTGQGLNHLAFQPGIDDGVAPAAQVHRHHCQGLVQRHNGVAHAVYASPVAHSLPEDPTQADASVLYKMMPARLQVSLGLKGYVN